LIVLALGATGCLGRSLATDSARLEVTWVLPGTVTCGADAPWLRIRSLPSGGNADDEELDWRPCLDESAMPRGLTAPVPLAVYEVTVGLAPAIDAAFVATSNAVTVDATVQIDGPYGVEVVF
jgi:hypothetical protein